MKEFVFLLCLCILNCTQGHSQAVLNFTVKQSPPLTVTTLKDTVLKKGDSIQLSVVVTGGSGSYTYSWTPVSGLNKADILSPVAVVDTTITYTLKVSDPNGCSKVSAVQLKVTTITALDPIATELGLQIFPSPNNGTFFITTRKPLNERYILIELFDALGNQVYKETVNGMQKLQRKIQMAAAGSGIYFIRLTGRKFSHTAKIFVQ